jgi:hypothetical protein
MRCQQAPTSTADSATVGCLPAAAAAAAVIVGSACSIAATMTSVRLALD